jgi:predicted nucleic acid-binding protein
MRPGKITILSFTRVVNPGIKLNVIKSADPDDNKILVCAVACGANYVVSGDAHLLELKEYKGIKIITPKSCAGYTEYPWNIALMKVYGMS